MAMLCSRLLTRNIRRKILESTRHFGTSIPPEDLATGLEKQEMIWLQSGNDDPYKMKTMKRHASTKANPNLVPSYFDCRIVGCICEEDSTAIIWMWLFKGEPKRCKCGHWFKLVEYRP